jgi:hypothetical protein
LRCCCCSVRARCAHMCAEDRCTAAQRR